MRLLLNTLVIFIIITSISPAQDIATEHTQLLNNIELISENLRQLQSLENQITMIKNQVIELSSVATYENNFTDIDGIRNELTNIISEGSALSNQTQNILTSIQQLKSNLPSNETLTDQEEAIDQQTLNIVQNALNRAAQLRQSYNQVIGSVNTLMDRNNQAVGQTQALQTSNQLAAQNIAQNQSTQELLSEQISLQSAMMSKELQDEKDEDSKMRQIFNTEDDGSNIFGPLN